MITFQSKSAPELNEWARPVLLMYTNIFHRDKVKSYSHIIITQWPEGNGSTVNPLWGKEIGVSLERNLPADVSSMDDKAKQLLVLELIHAGLVILAEEKKKLDVNMLDNVKQEILQADFDFWITYKQFPNKKAPDLTATVIVHPMPRAYQVYLQISRQEAETDKILVFEGIPSASMVGELFGAGKWVSTTEFVVTGKQSEIEVHFSTEDRLLKYVNISADTSKAPFFEKHGAKKDAPGALQDYLSTLNPELSDAIKKSLDNLF